MTIRAEAPDGRREEHSLTMRQWYRDDLEPLLRNAGFATIRVLEGIDENTLVTSNRSCGTPASQSDLATREPQSVDRSRWTEGWHVAEPSGRSDEGSGSAGALTREEQLGPGPVSRNDPLAGALFPHASGW
jgi:hypothetical protein